jgi:hypothetical protein
MTTHSRKRTHSSKRTRSSKRTHSSKRTRSSKRIHSSKMHGQGTSFSFWKENLMHGSGQGTNVFAKVMAEVS